MNWPERLITWLADEARARLAEPAPPPLSPRHKYALYLEARQAYEHGTGTLEEMTALVDDDVRDLIVQDEENERRARAARLAAELAREQKMRQERRARLMRPLRAVAQANFTAWALTLLFIAELALIGWMLYMTVTMVATSGAGYAAAPAPPPTVTVVRDGEGELIIWRQGGVRENIPVTAVYETKWGDMTILPVWYVTDDGQLHTWNGEYIYIPEHPDFP